MKPYASIGITLTLLPAVACVAPGEGPRPTTAQSRNLMSPWTAARGEPGWTVDLTLGIESEPDYAGSDDSETEPDLFARALYEDRRGHRYILNLGEVGAWWNLGDDWLLGTVLEYEQGRDNENTALTGFDAVDDTVEGQFSLARRFGDFSLAGVLQPDLLGRGKGFVAFVAGGYDRMLTERLRLALGADLSTGDAEHMDTEFGVSASAAAASGLAEYNPGAGLKSATVDVALEHFFTDRFSLFLTGSAEHYFARAADSPLIDVEGSDLVYELGLGLRYSF
ncbi:MAG: MipA/OmpV family protein [Planctomycetota bacterium]